MRYRQLTDTAAPPGFMHAPRLRFFRTAEGIRERTSLLAWESEGGALGAHPDPLPPATLQVVGAPANMAPGTSGLPSTGHAGDCGSRTHETQTFGTNVEYATVVQAHLNKWDAQVDLLVAEGKNASGEARAAHDRRLKELRLSRKAAQESLQEMRASRESAGAPLQARMRGIWEAMQKVLEKVSSDLRK